MLVFDVSILTMFLFVKLTLQLKRSLQRERDHQLPNNSNEQEPANNGMPLICKLYTKFHLAYQHVAVHETKHSPIMHSPERYIDIRAQ